MFLCHCMYTHNYAVLYVCRSPCKVGKGKVSRHKGDRPSWMQMTYVRLLNLQKKGGGGDIARGTNASCAAPKVPHSTVAASASCVWMFHVPRCSFVLLQFCPHREVSLIFSQLLAGGRWVLAQSASSPCYLLTPVSVCMHKLCFYIASKVL